MAVSCDLEVDVNGEETFFLAERILSSYSGKLRKLFGKSTGTKRKLKVIFQDFPGGGESFELISKFCYNSGRIDITPGNISLLHCTAQFMEMNASVAGSDNLLEQTEKVLDEISYWSLSDLLVALKQCEDLLPLVNSSSVLDKCLDSLVGRLALISEASPCPSTSSPESSGLRFSCDTRSTESLKTNFSRATWWFDDLLFMSPNLLELVIKSMVSRRFDSCIISRFLFYYQKSKFHTAKSDEKCKILELVIETFHGLDKSSFSCKSLFGILRVAQSLSISKCSRNKLESMIGFQIDQATLDNLLIPSPNGISYLYDVNLVLRFLKAFLRGGKSQASPNRTRKVAILLDLYIAEVAPDPCLKPSKFIALLSALPNSFRDCYDQVYRAMDMYLEVHGGLSEEEKMKMCCALNYKKLSPETCIHLSQNAKFPSKSSIQALVSQQMKLKNLLQCGNSPRSPPLIKSKGNKEAGSEQQIVLYAGKLMISDDKEELRAHLQGMQWRVMELEKVCRKMQTQVTKIMKAKPSNHSNARSLPRLCS